MRPRMTPRSVDPLRPALVGQPAEGQVWGLREFADHRCDASPLLLGRDGGAGPSASLAHGPTAAQRTGRRGPPAHRERRSGAGCLGRQRALELSRGTRRRAAGSTRSTPAPRSNAQRCSRRSCVRNDHDERCRSCRSAEARGTRCTSHTSADYAAWR